MSDEELDVAVLSLVLHYTVDPRDALAEAWRALKPGGRILAVELREHDRGAEYAEEMGHVWPGFTTHGMEAWLREAGFERVHTSLLPPDPEALGPLLFVATGTRP